NRSGISQVNGRIVWGSHRCGRGCKRRPSAINGWETTTAINIALIYAASPVLITLGAVVGLKESFSWRQSLGVVIALLGVLHVVVKGQWAALSQV
ncbi:MAG: EamA family transporter, partial [Ilumatobacteraceae bacterium]|nr:EamA family transporter [Ilumatobacteraceae bacterium]